MHWPEPQRLTAAQQDATDIQDTALTAGANIAIAEIDNRDGRLTRLALVADGSTPARPPRVAHQLALITAGRHYEDGAAAVTRTDPRGRLPRQRRHRPPTAAEIGIPIGPFRFKVLLVSELSQNSTVRLPLTLIFVSRRRNRSWAVWRMPSVILAACRSVW